MLDRNNYKEIITNLRKAIKEDDRGAKQRFLLDNPDLNKLCVYGHTLLHYLVLRNREKYLPVIKFLLESSGADHTIKSDCNNSICIGASVFARAVMAKNVGCVELFLERHNNPPALNTTNNIHRYGARMARAINNKAQQKYKLDFDERDDGGNTTLMSAIWRRHGDYSDMEIIIKLVECGDFDLDARNLNGNTALHFAVLRNLTEVVILLLENDADPEIENEDGEMPIDLASEFTDPFIIDALANMMESYEKSESSYSESETESSSEEIIQPEKRRKRSGSYIEPSAGGGFGR